MEDATRLLPGLALSDNQTRLLQSLLDRRVQFHSVQCESETREQIESKSTSDIIILQDVYRRHYERFVRLIKVIVVAMEVAAPIPDSPHVVQGGKKCKIESTLGGAAITCYDALKVILREISDTEDILECRSMQNARVNMS
jgi:hypothetical protein